MEEARQNDNANPARQDDAQRTVVEETVVIENPYQPPTGTNAERTARSRVGLMIGLSLFALLFGGAAQRIVPGGPFISLFGDILPTAAAVGAMWCSLAVLRGQDGQQKMVAACCLLTCTFALSNVIQSVLSFWFRPHARGDFFGF